MSEQELETHQSTMDAMLDAIYNQNLSQSRAHFDNLMNDKISDALESEKVNIASQLYNDNAVSTGIDTQEDDMDDVDWADIDQEIENAFEEGDEELADIDSEIDNLEV